MLQEGQKLETNWHLLYTIANQVYLPLSLCCRDFGGKHHSRMEACVLGGGGGFRGGSVWAKTKSHWCVPRKVKLHFNAATGHRKRYKNSRISSLIFQFGKHQHLNYHFMPNLAVADPGFPRGGGANPKGGGRQPIIWPIFSENCMKMKKFWAGGGASLAPPLDPPLLGEENF